MKTGKEMLKETQIEQDKLNDYLNSETTISFKLPSLLRDEFKEACQAKESDMKAEVIKFIDDFVKEYKEKKEESMNMLKKDVNLLVDEFVKKAGPSEKEFVRAKILQTNPTPVSIAEWRKTLSRTFAKMRIPAPIFNIPEHEFEKIYKKEYVMFYTLFNFSMINAIIESEK